MAQDSRLANGVGGGFVYTGHGAAEPVEIFVDDIIGFGNIVVDGLTVVIMLLIIYGVVWGGLYRMVGLAVAAERRKQAAEEDS